MKRVLIMLTSIIFFVSCQQEEACYSCDENIDAFVKENLAKIQEMSRTDIIQYPNQMQRAMFGALSAEKKKEIWLNKFDQMKLLNISVAEQQHINKFRQFVAQKDMSEAITTEEKQMLLNLRDEGIAKFGWTQRFIVSAFGYLENVDQNGIILQNRDDVPVIDIDPNEKPKCDCDWGFGCLDGPCDRRPKVCIKTTTDCGWFLLEECVALCRPDLG